MAITSPINLNGIVVETKLDWNDSAIKKLGDNAMLGMFKLGGAMAAQARSNAPVVTTALRQSIRVEAEGNIVYVRAGGTVVFIQQKGKQANKRVDYAYKREKGPNRNPATVHYMENAERAVMNGDWQKYFREELK